MVPFLIKVSTTAEMPLERKSPLCHVASTGTQTSSLRRR